MKDPREADRIIPGSDAAYERWVQAEIDRELGRAEVPDRIQLFGGPRRLVEIAAKLASTRKPTPERLICHPRDYELAGLWQRGPMIYIAIRPPLTSFTFTPWKPGEPMPDESRPRKCSLEPDPRCPPNEIRVVS